MQIANSLSDSELLARMPVLVLHERRATADVIEHLVEIDRRDLYLGQACSSLSAYCRERLGYSEDEASKRVRVARSVRAVPELLEELRGGSIHLTGLFVLSSYLTAQNAPELIAAARGKTRRELERALAARFPKANVQEQITPQTGNLLQSKPGSVQPLSDVSFAVQFTASAELHSKIARAKELLSHSIPDEDLARVVERAMDALIAREERRRMGAGQPRKRRALREGSRHVPVEVARQVWERDRAQCTFVDAEGRRCSERRFITIEHRVPFGMGGSSLDRENLCLLCGAHNQFTAQRAYGREYMKRKRNENAGRRRNSTSAKVAATASEARPTPPLARDEAANEQRAVDARVLAALCGMGFRKHDASLAIEELQQEGLDAPSLLRAAIQRLTPNCVQS